MSTSKKTKKKASTDAGTETTKDFLLPSDYIQGPVAVVQVGPEQEVFRLHRDLLVAQSPFFATRLKDCWGGVEKDIELSDIDLEAFQVVADWMYTSNIPRLSSEVDLEAAHVDLLRRTYKVAELLMMPRLQNDLIDIELNRLSLSRECIPVSNIWQICKDDLVHTPLYRLYLKIWVQNLVLDNFSKDEAQKDLDCLNQYPQTLADIIICTAQWYHGLWDQPFRQKWCEHHVHDEGESCTTKALVTLPTA